MGAIKPRYKRVRSLYYEVADLASKSARGNQSIAKVHGAKKSMLATRRSAEQNRLDPIDTPTTEVGNYGRDFLKPWESADSRAQNN